MSLAPFHLLKVAQAVAVLLKCEDDRRMGRLRLLKLLYIADRERMQESGRPITGDRAVAMDHGPVLSQTYNLIRGHDVLTPQWEQFIRSAGKRDVMLYADPGVGKLTRKEIAKLQDVSKRYEELDDYQIAEITHEFPEYKKNAPAKGARKDIPLPDLIEATGLAPMKDQLLLDAANERLVDHLLEPVDNP